jgi:hypothetical protein
MAVSISPPDGPRPNCCTKHETSAGNIALVLQGLLIAGDRVAEAGLSAQPKAHPNGP